MIVPFTNETNLKLEYDLNQEVGPNHTFPYPICLMRPQKVYLLDVQILWPPPK